jgi:hypothetical protein
MIRQLLGIAPPKPKLSSFVMVVRALDGTEVKREVIQLSAAGVNSFLERKGKYIELYTVRTGAKLG